MSGAFLPRDGLKEDMWCQPLPEISKALRVDENTPLWLCSWFVQLMASFRLHFIGIGQSVPFWRVSATED